MAQKLLTLDEAAARLGISSDELIKLIDQRKMFQDAGHGPAIRYGYHLAVLRPNTGGRLAQARARALQSRQCLDHGRMHVHSFLQTAEVAPPRRMRLRPGWLWCTIRRWRRQ